MLNMIRGMMAVRWTRKSLRLTFCVSREFVEMYLIHAASAEQVVEIIRARAAIATDF